jgi:aminomethyltransferase
VGYSHGPEIARRLEENNIIVNYQAAPGEEGFSASGALRMGVQEMTRFGMKEADFASLAQLIHDAVAEGRQVGEEAKALRQRFLELKFCFSGKEYEQALARLQGLI